MFANISRNIGILGGLIDLNSFSTSACEGFLRTITFFYDYVHWYSCMCLDKRFSHTY